VGSPRIKTAPQAAAGGWDGGQQVKGRNRPGGGGTPGRLRAVVATAADTQERGGGRVRVTPYFLGGGRRVRKLGGESGAQAEWLAQGGRDLKPTQKLDWEGTGKEGKGSQGVPWRWAGERPLAWVLPERRHRRDDERLPAKSAAMSQLSMIRLLLNRLA
jgi:hypothetical protein